MSAPKQILVVANETVVGNALIDAVKRHRDDGEVSVHVICPQSTPKHGYVVYDDTVRGAAENRLAIAIAQLLEIGVEATGEVMDPDPYSAITDATGERDYEAIILSTHPETRSGWLRQDLVVRVAQGTGLPVEHVIVDLDADKGEATHTLVVANQTVGGQPLVDQLKALSDEGPRRFVVICPQSGGGEEEEARGRLAQTLEHLSSEGIEATGQLTHPDPYTAIMNGLDFYDVDEIVISTFPETRSGWLRGDLVGRVRSSTSKPVHHVVSGDEDEAAQPPADAPGSAD